jgi:hypothetical protein
MTYNQSIQLPINRRDYAQCGDPQPHGWFKCNRPNGHTGRHAFYWRHIDGRVRAVWS